MTNAVAVICAVDAHVPAAFDDLVITRATRERDSMRAALARAIAPLEVTRLVVVGGADHPDALLAAAVSRLMIAGRLDVEVAYVAPGPTPATSTWGLPHGRTATELALSGSARDLPLIRDDAAVVVVGEARHRGPDGTLVGETYVDSERLFTGSAREVRVRPTRAAPGVQAALPRRMRTRWLSGRAVQTGGVDIVVERDGVVSTHPVKRSTVYRNADDWKVVCE